MKFLRTASLLLCLILLTLACVSCGSDPAKGLDSVMYAEIDMKDGSYIKLELYTTVAPITVANFVNLVNDHFYDGLIFHRVISGFMIQAGDPKGDGTGGSKQMIKGEFAANGIANNLAHTRGVISMARFSNNMDSASSQFFIVHQDTYRSSLDGKYAAFGKVIEGMETVDKIASVATDQNDKPLADQKIKTIRIITKEQAQTPGMAPLPAESETAAK